MLLKFITIIYSDDLSVKKALKYYVVLGVTSVTGSGSQSASYTMSSGAISLA